MAKTERPFISLTDALIIVDLQNDFCPGGQLAVPNGDKIVPVVNRIMRVFNNRYATKDWHPANHCSFAEFGGLWPPHCVQNTWGAEFHPDLDLRGLSDSSIFYKGFDPARDSYSAFGGVALGAEGRQTSCTPEQALFSCERIFVAGLATDYCVKATVLDALQLDFEVYVVVDAIAAVDAKPGDGARALAEMAARGARLCGSNDILRYWIIF